MFNEIIPEWVKRTKLIHEKFTNYQSSGSNQRYYYEVESKLQDNMFAQGDLQAVQISNESFDKMRLVFKHLQDVIKALLSSKTLFHVDSSAKAIENFEKLQEIVQERELQKMRTHLKFITDPDKEKKQKKMILKSKLNSFEQMILESKKDINDNNSKDVIKKDQDLEKFDEIIDTQNQELLRLIMTKLSKRQQDYFSKCRTNLSFLKNQYHQKITSTNYKTKFLSFLTENLMHEKGFDIKMFLINKQYKKINQQLLQECKKIVLQSNLIKNGKLEATDDISIEQQVKASQSRLEKIYSQINQLEVQIEFGD